MRRLKITPERNPPKPIYLEHRLRDDIREGLYPFLKTSESVEQFSALQLQQAFDKLRDEEPEIRVVSLLEEPPEWLPADFETPPADMPIISQLCMTPLLPVPVWLGYQNRSPARAVLYLNTLHKRNPTVIKRPLADIQNYDFAAHSANIW